MVLACDSPFEPQGNGERVPINREITDEVSADSVARYSFVGRGGEIFTVFLEALEGQVQMSIQDSTHSRLVGAIADGPGSPTLHDNPSPNFSSPDDAVYNLLVGTFTDHARFRFLIYPVNLPPENAPARFTIGDTVSGETLDLADIDEFFVHGDAGQEIFAVVEVPGPAGSGSMVLIVSDPSTRDFIGFAYGTSAVTPQTSGRIQFPTSQDYKFSFSTFTGPFPRYQGAYRFWTYSINRAPEHRAAAIQFDTEVNNEKIDRAGDVDEFTFVANPGDQFKAFIQAPWVVGLEVVGSSGSPIAVGTSQPTDTSLFFTGTSRFTIPTPGTYTLRLSGASPSLQSDTGRYRIFLHAVDPAPEHVAGAITPGDTVTGEDINLPGDVDEFTFSGVAGAEYNAFIEPQNGSPNTRLQLEVLNAAGAVLRTLERFGSDTGLLEGPTGRFALPSTGTYRLRVSGVDGFGSQFYRGPYRVALHQIDRQPESRPRTFAFGDSVSGERIDGPGDVDEFIVTVPDSSGANLAIAIDSGVGSGGLMVQLLDSATGQLVGQAGALLTPARGGSGRLSLAAGKYLLRVWPSTYEFDRSTFRGAYRLWFYRFSFRPEVAADTFAIGDTVGGESIEPWGDEDRFYFYGLEGQHVNIMVQGLGAGPTGWFQFQVFPPPGVPGYGAFLNAQVSGTTLEDVQSNRLDLLGTGWYTVVVHGGGGGLEERGPYRFTVLPFDPGPEHVGATLSVGDSVTNEPIDQRGDWDEFTLVAAPGQTVSILFDGDVYTGLALVVRDPATGDTLASQPNQFRRIAGPFRMPAGGQVKVFVAQHADFFRDCYNSTCNLFSYAGPYRFSVLAINPAPESAPAMFVIGDTVRGEAITPEGDIDEFTSTGTPGQQLALLVRLTVKSTIDSAIALEAIDPATDSSLAGSNAASWGDAFFTLGTFMVPASGVFKVRAHAWGQGYGVGVTPQYEFLVKPGP